MSLIALNDLQINKLDLIIIAQLAWAVEYTDCTSAKG